MSKIKLSLADLPSYIHTTDSDVPYFLTINKAKNGSWSAGYIEFETHGACVAINDADDLNEIAVRMKYALDRFTKRSKDDGKFA